MAESSDKKADGWSRENWWMAGVFLAIALFHTGFVVAEAGAEGRFPDIEFGLLDEIRWLAIGAGMVSGGLLLLLWLRRFAFTRTRLFERAVKVCLSVALLCGGTFYFAGTHGIVRNAWPHDHDTYHYLLGPKYYAEMSYADLYRCTVQAVPKAFPRRHQIRDLTTNKKVKMIDFEVGPPCEDDFGPERWEEFKADLAVYTKNGKRNGTIRGPTGDLGYNGTPTLSALGYFVAKTFSISEKSLHYCTLIDAWALCIMMFFVTRAFGWRLGALFAFAFFLNPVDRHSIIGASFLRYSWMVALTLGIASLRRDRYLAAGAWLAAATMLNVHPAVFIFGVLVKAGYSWLKTKKLALKYRQFIVAGAITGAALGAFGMTPRGFQAWPEFRANLGVHNATGRMPGFGVGYKWVFLYRGEHYRKKWGFSRKNKVEQFREMEPIYRVTALGMILFAAAICTRVRDTEAAILLGFTTMFCLLGTTGYYFLSAAFMVLLWYKRLWSAGPALMVVLFFAGHLLILAGFHKWEYTFFAYNTLTSYTWTAYLLATLTWFGVSTGLFRDIANAVAGSPPPDEPPTEPTESE